MIALRRSSYSAIRVSDCCTSSCDVTRCCCRARCMSVMEVSTTVIRCGIDGAAATAATAASARISPLVFIGRCRSAECTAGLLQQICLDEWIEVAVENAIDVANLHLRAVILDHLVCLLYTSDAADERSSVD